MMSSYKSADVVQYTEISLVVCELSLLLLLVLFCDYTLN